MDHVMNDYWPVLTLPRAIPRATDEGASLSALWTELVSGLCKIEHTEFTQQTCTVVVTRSHRLSGVEGARQGKSYQEMAKLRDTSKRTVAYQLSSAFDRLGISGRAELLCLLAKRKLGGELPDLSAKPVLALSPDTVLGFPRVAGRAAR
jgi:DNA-binding NarL/FixJ family response regulator